MKWIWLLKRKIEKLINICIVTFDYKYVPEEFTNILLLDVKQQSNFMETLQNELVNEKKQNQLEESDTVKKQLSGASITKTTK